MSSPQVEATLGNVDDRPLTPREYALVQRIFSDPFSFPQAFKTWLVSYLETTDLTLPLGAVSGLSSAIATSPDIRGGLASLTTDAGGIAHVAFPAPVTAVKSVVVTNANASHGHVHFSAFNSAPGGFDILAWDVVPNVALATAAIDVSWLALVTP